MSRRNAILAIDPGKTTGIAFHDWSSGATEFLELDYDETCAYVLDKALYYETDLHIVSEAFIITPHTAKNTQAPWSLELIGFSRWVSRSKTHQDLTLQAPSSAKNFSTTGRLKHLGYWTTGSKGHANDAARHLLLLEGTRGWLSQEVLLTLADIT